MALPLPEAVGAELGGLLGILLDHFSQSRDVAPASAVVEVALGDSCGGAVASRLSQTLLANTGPFEKGA